MVVLRPPAKLLTAGDHRRLAGVTVAGPDGDLRSITEQTGIAPEEVGLGRRFSGEETVSMNCWGFTPAVWPGLDAQFQAFVGGLTAGGKDPLKAEFYLPAAVSAFSAT